MTTYRDRAAGLVGGLAIVIAGSATANAQLTFVGTFRNLVYGQSSPGSAAFVGAFFSADANFTLPGQYTAANLTYPVLPSGATTIPLSAVSPTDFATSQGFTTQAAMDAAFPMGTYTFDVTGGSEPSQMVDVDYNIDAYTADIPLLSDTSFGALIGLDTKSSSLTLAFNAFTPAEPATVAFTFFSIGGSQSCGFLDPSATSCTIDPSALAPGTTYTWELDFSDRIETPQGDGLVTYTDFDVRTDGVFTTAAAAAPEASTWAMILTGFAGLAFAARRRTPARVA
jgi:hypothetical protein